MVVPAPPITRSVTASTNPNDTPLTNWPVSFAALRIGVKATSVARRNCGVRPMRRE